MLVAPSSSEPGRVPGFAFTCRLSPDGRYTFSGPAAEIELLFESTAEDISEMLTSGKLPFVVEEERDVWLSIRASASNLSPWSSDTRIRSLLTGREHWLRIHSIPRRERDGVVTWDGVITDITDLKAAEERQRARMDKLARNESRLRAALAGARAIGWELDLKMNQWETTVDLCEFYGLPPGSDDIDCAVMLAGVHPDDLDVVLAIRQRVYELGSPIRYEFRGRVAAQDGSIRRFTTFGEILRDEAGNATRLVAVTTEISDTKNSELDREVMNQQLLDTQKWESLGVLAGGVAHDFNNILTVVLGSAGLARKGLPIYSSAGPHLDQIEQACRRAADLCRQLLAYAGRGPVAAGRMDLNNLVRSFDVFQAIPKSQSVTVRCNLATGLPPVAADAGSIRQVLANLVLNAAEALGDDGGEVVIETRLVEIGRDFPGSFRLPARSGRYVCLSVSDTGIGIPTDVQEYMFDPFFSTKFAGRGLGLAAVLGIMRTHFGTIRVISAVGKGSTVELCWPVVGDNPGVAMDPVSKVKASSGKALVVDDEMYVREVTASTLQEIGYEPILAGDGRTALKLFEQHQEELRVAVIDVVMPGMSGDRLLKEVRMLKPNLPVVLVSGLMDRRIIGSLASSHTEFVQKPFHPEELISVVRRLLGS